MLTPILLPLLAIKKIPKEKIWNPPNATMLFIPILLNVYLPTADNVTDLQVGIEYGSNKTECSKNPEGDSECFQNYHPTFSTITILVTFLPFFVRLLIELKNTLHWILKDRILFLSLWDKILLNQAKDVVSVLPFVSPIINLGKIITLSQIHDGDPEAENTQLQMASHSSWEPFLESLPQFVLQLFVSIKRPPGSALAVSIIISVISLSLACSSSFLMERIRYPVASDLIPKFLLSLLFLFVVIARVMNIAVFFHICNETLMLQPFIGKMIVITFPIIAILSLAIAVKVNGKNVQKSPILDESVNVRNEYGISGIYIEKKQNELKTYFKELEVKAIILSIFVPCIIVSEETNIYTICNLVTTGVHLVAAGFSWTMFQTDESFQISSNRSCSQFDEISRDCIFGVSGHYIFPILVGLVFLSSGILEILNRLSNHMTLRKFLKKLNINFNHGGVIASIIENYRKKEFEMEMTAKLLGGPWDPRLRMLKNKQDITEKQSYSQLESIAKENINLARPVIIRRTSSGIMTKVPIEMIEHNRHGNDYLVSVLDNLRKNNAINQEGKQLRDRHVNLEEVTKMHYTLKQMKNISCLYRAIKETTNINCEDDQNSTALMIAIKQSDSQSESDTLLQIRLLLYFGASLSYNNSSNKNAFEDALEYASEETKIFLWKRLQDDKEHQEVFMDLCRKQNVEGVKWCLNHTPNDKKLKEMIEDQENIEKEFPLLCNMYELNIEMSLLLIKEHKRLNPDFLTTCDAHGTNALIYASRLRSYLGIEPSERKTILKELIDVYVSNNKLDSREKARGLNAFMFASYYGEYESLKFLIPYYAEANLLYEKDINGQNALELEGFDPFESGGRELLKKYYE